MPQPYEWAALRVVPRVDRCEFVNAGVVIYCQQLDYLAARVALSAERGRSLDPDLDLEARRPARWPDEIRARAEKLVVPMAS